MECWTPIPEFPGYSVSNLGRVRNDRHVARYMSPFFTGGGNVHVAMVRDGTQYNRALAKLVAEAYLKPPNASWHLPTPILLNGDKTDCNSENLMWRPRWFANKYTRQFNQKFMTVGNIRDIETGIVFRDIWDELVMVHGLLFVDIVQAIEYRTTVFPTFQRFEWA